MSNRKHKNSPSELSSQKIRTHKNLIDKYTKLILNNPKDPHIKAWERKIEEIKNSIIK